MHLYAFGSLCRGEVDKGSDVDLLSIDDRHNDELDSNIFSVYSYSRLQELWKEGNPFAWHLSLEAKLVFASNKQDFLADLGKPKEYIKAEMDCQKFYEIFSSSVESLNQSHFTNIFDLSLIFLSIRNFASCYALQLKKPIFSRSSALMLGSDSLQISSNAYDILERCRILCTRGKGKLPSEPDFHMATTATEDIDAWMLKILQKIKGIKNERV